MLTLLGAAAVWARWTQLLGVRLTVGVAGHEQRVGLTSVGLVSAAAFAAAVGLLVFLSHRHVAWATARAWRTLCYALTLLSLAGAVVAAANPTVATALMTLHLWVGAMASRLRADDTR